MPRILRLITIILFLQGHLRAQKATVAELTQMSLEDLLQVKAIAATRTTRSNLDSARSLTIITAEQLRRGNYRSLPEALVEAAGVMVQHTNYGGGAPIIRGMIGNRILILVDGVRINNAFFRLGPNQYLNAIDLYMVERIEVIRGPGSVLYGSDALGGVINVVTRSAESSTHPFETRLRQRFATADRGISDRVDLNGSVARFSFAGGFSGKWFDNLNGGARTGMQPNTGYDEWAGDLRLRFQLSNRSFLQLSGQRLRQDNVPRTDNLSSGADLKYQWNPLRRDMLALTYHVDSPTRWLDSLEVTLQRQNLLERVERIAASKPAVDVDSRDEVSTNGLELQLGSHWGERHLLTYGASFHADHIASTRVAISRKDGTRTSQAPTVPDGSLYNALAVYLQDEIPLDQRWALTLGTRFSRIHLHATASDPQVGSFNVRGDPSSLTSSAYLSFKPATDIVLFGGIAQGFRAPSIEDSAALQSFAGGSGFEVPSPSLVPERNLEQEAGIKGRWGRWTGTASFFFTQYRGLIDRMPTQYQGLTFVDSNHNGRKDSNEPNVYQRQNGTRAEVLGAVWEAQFRLRPSFSFYGDYTWTFGKYSATLDPLTRIPPAHGRLGTHWSPRRYLHFETYSIASTRQSRLSPSDLVDLRIRKGGTPGFATLNTRVAIDIPHLGLLTAALENITGKSYRWHGSGIDAPGRNLILGLGWGF